MEKLTWTEFYKLALQHYNSGGDGIVECWTEADYNEFGHVTKSEALDMFTDRDEIIRDREADAIRSPRQWRQDARNKPTYRTEELQMKRTNTGTTKKGYYNPETIRKFSDALKAAAEAVTTGADTRVRISNSNSKMGAVASVSTLPFITCPASCAGTCGPACYAAKLANLRPAVLKAYAINTALAIHRPAEYWAQVEAAVMAVRFFRFHVSGDIINADYFDHITDIASRNPHTEILVFTKRYNLVNAWIDRNGQLPGNLHILFSGWSNLTPDNPHNLPETNVYTTEDEIKDSWKLCGGNCFNCACRGVGCWQAQSGDTIAFKKH